MSFYSYGLQLFRNISLIEPLEYRDIRCVVDFVIAIDTSKSIDDRLLSYLANETYNIIQQQEGSNHQFNIHVVQCDDKIQEFVKLTNQQEQEDYFRFLILKGLRGMAFQEVKADFNNRVKALSLCAVNARETLDHVFRFCESTFAEGLS